MLQNKEDYLNNSAFVKTVLMMLVILGHSIVFWNERWIDWTPAYKMPLFGVIYDWLNSFHVFSFTLISGYIFAFKMNGGYSSYRRFVKNKACRLLIPYVFVAAAWVIPLSYICFRWDIVTIIQKFVLCTNPSQLWFLWMLFDIFIIVWPLWKIIRKSELVLILLGIGSYCCGICGQRVLPNILCIWTAFTYMPFFLIGVLIRQKQEKDRPLIVEKIPVWAWVGLHVIAFVVYKTYFGDVNGLLMNAAKLGLHFALNGIGAIMGFIVLHQFGRYSKLGESKGFRRLARLSMPIYLFHQQIIYCVIYLLNGRVNPYVNALTNFVIAVIISIAISIILMRWKITRRLIGTV